MDNPNDILFTPMKVGGTTVKNKIVLLPMGGNSILKGGVFHEDGAKYYIERAKGGAGLLIDGNEYAMDIYHRADWWIHESLEKYRKEVRATVDAIHSYGVSFYMQIGAGLGRNIMMRIAPPGSDVEKALVASSDGLPNVYEPEKLHRAMTVEEIHEIVESYRQAAGLLRELGFDGIEISALHEGHLLDEFVTEHWNRRTDEYGGSFENRMRFITEIVQAIKSSAGDDFPISVRFAATHKIKGFNEGALPGERYDEFGRTLEDSIEVARYLEGIGVHMLDADNGCTDADYWPHPPTYMPMCCNLEEVSALKRAVGMTVVCGGRMEDLGVTVPAVREGRIDGVGLGRQLLADPDWPNKVREHRVDDIRPCLGCHNGCIVYYTKTFKMSCAVNPTCGAEEKYAIVPVEHPKSVVVVGGGISGMETARLCAMRGHHVTLLEKTDELGGVFIAAAAHDFKEADKQLLRWYRKQVADQGVDVRMSTEATPELLAEMDPDEIVIATGAKKKVPPVAGIDGANVLDAIEALRESAKVGERVVIVGGGLTGCELAYSLAKGGKKVTVLEMLDDILTAKGICEANSEMLRDLLAYHKVEIVTSARLTEVTPEGVEYERDGERASVPADTVVLAMGYDSGSPLAKSLGERANVHVLGDAEHVGNVMDAVWSAYELAFSL